MDTKNIGDQDRQQNYRTEYGVVADGWKFFASLRFIVAAFAVALQSALFTFYTQAGKGVSGKEGTALVIAFVGAGTIFAITWIEERTVMFLLKTMQRGTELEFSFGALDGFFHRLTEEFFLPQSVRKIARRMDGLAIVYVMLFLLWLYLVLTNLINLQK